MEKDQVVAENEADTVESDAPTEVQAGTDTEESAGAEEAVADSPEKLGLLLEDARAKADEHWNQLVRARAEMDNLRKRQARELENAHKFALERFVNELLPVRDSMEMGLNAAREEGTDVAKLLEGNELTLKLLSDVMSKFDVEQVDPQGEPFNPELHQAMSMLPREDVPPNTVVNVVQKGYTLKGRLVRPAMVMVSQAVE